MVEALSFYNKGLCISKSIVSRKAFVQMPSTSTITIEDPTCLYGSLLDEAEVIDAMVQLAPFDQEFS